jgi:hypothetical protein
MFSTILAYGVFSITTIIFLVLIIDALIPKSELDKSMEKLEQYISGKKRVTDWRKIFVFFVLWAASGIYLWG